MAARRWELVAVAALVVAVFGAGLPAWPDAVRVTALVLAAALVTVAWRLRRQAIARRDADSMRDWGGAGDRPAARIHRTDVPVDQRLGGYGAGQG